METEYSIKREVHHDERRYKQYQKDGGKLTRAAYRSALASCWTFRYPFSSFSQATNMLRMIVRDPSEQSPHTINAGAIKRTYGYLRDQPDGECGSWSDQKVFAETLLLHNYFAAYKAFKGIFPNIFPVKYKRTGRIRRMVPA